jgi:signal transduction histidine kinase
MSLVTQIDVGFAVFAFCTGIFNLWLYWMRPREASHLWLGVASLGVVWLAAGYALSYQAATLAEAQSAVLVALGGTLPMVLGFLRFSELFAGISHPALRGAIVYTALVVGAVYAQPDLLFSGEAIPIDPPFGARYVRAGLAASAALPLAGFGLLIVAVVAAYARRAATLQGGLLLPITLTVWGACMLNDLCVAVGWYWGPWLLPIGFTLFASAFGSILLERLVRSHAHLERNAGELHTLVELRTDELRRKDLELAHGARLATLGALAGGIAHEIEEPLAEIDAHVKELRGAYCDATRPAAFRELLAKSQRSVERIRVVVAELLRLARREEGERGVHELPEIVASVLPIASYELRRRARLETHLASTPPVAGDAAMLAQIALNLIVGAIHAAPEEGNGANALISLTTEERDGRARIVVADNLPALPGEAAPDLFDLAALGGLGHPRRIGFAVTRQLVERHGGTLSVESSASGTCVSVEFPAASSGVLR